MRLVRNLTRDKRGKYAIIRMNKLPDDPGKRADCDHAFRQLEHNGMLEWGEPGTENEFFVVLLKDENAQAALDAYATKAAYNGDAEYCTDVRALAHRAGPGSKWCKKPD